MLRCWQTFPENGKDISQKDWWISFSLWLIFTENFPLVKVIEWTFHMLLLCYIHEVSVPRFGKIWSPCHNYSIGGSLDHFMKSSSRSDCSNYLVCKSSGWFPYTHIIFDHDHCWYTKHYCHYKAFWWAHTDLLECSPLTFNLCCPISKVTPARTDRAGQWGVLSEKQENTQLDLLRHGAPPPPVSMAVL